MEDAEQRLATVSEELIAAHTRANDAERWDGEHLRAMSSGCDLLHQALHR